MVVEECSYQDCQEISRFEGSNPKKEENEKEERTGPIGQMIEPNPEG